MRAVLATRACASLLDPAERHAEVRFWKRRVQWIAAGVARCVPHAGHVRRRIRRVGQHLGRSNATGIDVVVVISFCHCVPSIRAFR